MSSYRDDTQETAVASDATWLNIAALTEDGTRAVASLLFALAVTHGDQAIAGDEVIDRAHHVVQETTVASDSSSGHLQAAVLVAEQARVSERLSERLRVLQADSATAGDTVLDRARAAISERATASDTLLGQRRAQALIAESARASDFSRSLRTRSLRTLSSLSHSASFTVLSCASCMAQSMPQAVCVDRAGVNGVLQALHLRCFIPPPPRRPASSCRASSRRSAFQSQYAHSQFPGAAAAP